MAFFGPGGLAGRSEPGIDPQLMQALMAQFPGLQGLQAQGQQQPGRTLQTLGYQGAGPQFFQGQGQGSFTLSPFESAGGVSPESITGGLAQGTFGRSASISPLGTPSPQQQSSLLSLPSLSLPMAQMAAAQGGYGGDETMGGPAPEGQGGFTINAGDMLGAGQQIAGLFSPGTGTAFDPSQQMQSPAYQQQRAGERDMSTLGGSFLGNLQGSQLLAPPAPISSFLSPAPLAPDSTFSMLQPGELLTQTPQALTPGTTFSMPGAGETMFAPGGSAQQALGQSTPQGDLLGGGLSTLQGLYNLYGGTQTGDIGQLLGGAGGVLGGAGQMAPETVAALSQYLGMGAGGLGLAAGGLGGLAGGYGLYQGIQQGDPMQALMGAGGLYAGAAPLVNAALGTSLPTLSSLGSTALSAIAPELAASLGIGTGAATGAAGAAGAGAAAGGAAAGGAGAGTGAAAGGIGAAAAPAAALLAPAVITLLLDMFGRDPKDKGLIASALESTQGNYPTFVPELMQNVGVQQREFDMMQKALPFVQSKEELGQLLNSYRNALQTQTGIALEDRSGVGDPYRLSAIPGVGPITHGQQTTPTDFGPQEQSLQRIIDQMLGVLPGERITAGYGQPGGSLADEPMRRLRQQFDYMNNIPQLSAMQDPVTGLPTQAFPVYDPTGYRQYSPADIQNAMAAGTIAGQPAWDPATGAFVNVQGGQAPPKPSDYFQQSQYWPTIEQNLFNATPQGQYNQQFQQQIEQFIQQQQALTQQAPQLLQAAQTSLQGAPLSGAIPGAPGFTSSPTGGGGVDLMALLRQLGYVQ